MIDNIKYAKDGTQGGVMNRKSIKYLILLLVSCLIIPSFQAELFANEEKVDDIIEKNQYEEVEEVGSLLDELDVSELDENFNPEKDLEEGEIINPPIKVDDKVIFSPMVRSNQIPMTYDLRELNAVSPVKDQGKSGSCWAFATCGALESVLLNHKNGLYDFSEKHLRNMHGFDWSADKGGNRDMATAYLVSGKGPIAEKDDPFNEVIPISPNNVERLFDIEKVIFLPNGDTPGGRNEIKRAIMEYGGVYSVVNNNSFYGREENYSFYNSGHGGANHAITIVGWNDFFPGNAFNTKAPIDGAWICKNSYGSKYMDKGFYYVSYADGYIGRNVTCFVPEKKDPNGIIHQYDPCGITKSFGFAGKGYMANVFTAENDELLHEVGMYNLSNETEYKIYVVRDYKGMEDLGNKKELVKEGKFGYPGYYKIKIDPIKLSPGEKFAVIAYYDATSSGNRRPLPLETKIDNYTESATANEGESFVSKTGLEWADITHSKQIVNPNCCIKAITTTSNEVPDRKLDVIDNDNRPIDENKVRKIKFDLGANGYIELNKIGKIDYTLIPDVENTVLEFSSSNEDIAEFRYGGIIIPKKTGNVNVYIKVKDSKIRARFNVQVVNPGIRDYRRKQIREYVGELPLPTPLPEPMPEPGPYPPGPMPEPTPEMELPRRVYMDQHAVTLIEGDDFVVEPIVKVMPKTAIRDFTFESNKPDYAEVDSYGRIIAKKSGTALITIRAKDTLLKATLLVRILPDKNKPSINIVKFENSNITSDRLQLYSEATIDDRPYSGPANIVVETEDAVTEDKFYFNGGKLEAEFSDFDFKTLNKPFKATLTIKDEIKTIVIDGSSSQDEENLYPTEKKIEITEFVNSPRRIAGVFYLYIGVTENGKPYNGIAYVKTSSNSRDIKLKVRIRNGVGKVTYTGFSFGVWKKDFTSTIDVEGVTETIKFGY